MSEDTVAHVQGSTDRKRRVMDVGYSQQKINWRQMVGQFKTMKGSVLFSLGDLRILAHTN